MQQGQQGITRIGFQDVVTFIGSAAATNRSWNNIVGSLAEAGHRLRGDKCGVWAPGFEPYEDQELPTEVRDLCMQVPRKRHGVRLLGSAANVRYCVNVGLGQPAELPTQTTERVEKALATSQSIERIACDQHDTSALRRRGCSWERASRTPWITTSGWSHATFDNSFFFFFCFCFLSFFFSFLFFFLFFSLFFPTNKEKGRPPNQKWAPTKKGGETPQTSRGGTPNQQGRAVRPTRKGAGRPTSPKDEKGPPNQQGEGRPPNTPNQQEEVGPPKNKGGETTQPRREEGDQQKGRERPQARREGRRPNQKHEIKKGR